MTKSSIFVFGTRPEAIKMAPLIRAAQRDPRHRVFICSTGQHRDMLTPIFELFEIKPDFDFELMRPGQSLQDITIGVLEKLTIVVRDVKPDWIIVQGDTTTAMAASLCGFYERIKVAHVEAGLRTGHRFSPFPEEFNRRVTSLIADWHFAPTESSAMNLRLENVEPSTILVTGNTGIDALKYVHAKLVSDTVLQQQFQARYRFLDASKRLILVTIHRRESFGEAMHSIMRGLAKLAERPDVQLLIALHPNPNVRAAAEICFGKTAVWVMHDSDPSAASILLIEPQQYLDFVYLMSRCYFVMSDSGGIQEEAPALGKPVLVVRDNTERPEAVEAGTSRLIGTDEVKIISEANHLLDHPEAYAKMAQARSPFGDGDSSRRILEAIAGTPS